uniref:Uncharacterized protein n=1 Tax=Leersia perrieri TaxID=77586 RepID=A0A0D9XXA7_9ORYZ
MVDQPNFKKVIGEVKQAESVPPVQKKTAAPKEPKAKEVKKEAPKEAPKPKVEVPDSQRKRRHQSRNQRMLLIYCHQAR